VIATLRTNSCCTLPGHPRGLPPRLAVDDAKVVRAKELQKDHTLSVGDICRKLKISRSTYYRHVAK
jgi:hypothetical protein